MKFLSIFVLSTFANMLALWTATFFVIGFIVSGGPKSLAIAALILTAINTFIKPIVKLIFGPVIILTLGLGILLVNALMLSLLDFLSPNITIMGIIPLAYTTLIVSAVNLLISILIKFSK